MSPLLQIIALMREGQWTEAHALVQFDASCLVNHEQRAPIGLDAPIVNIQHILLSVEFLVEKTVQPFGAPHLQCFADHHGPGNNREKGKADDDCFAFSCGLLPHIKQFQLLRISSS